MIEVLLAQAIDDPDATLDDDMRRLLIDAVTSHLAARASIDSTEYMQVVDAESMRWITPDDEQMWDVITRRYQYLFSQLPDRSDPRKVLQELIDHQLGEGGQQIVSIGSAPDGMLVRVERVFHPDRAEQPLYLGSDEVHNRWQFGSAVSPLIFRRPALSPRSLVSRDGNAVIADVYVVVTLSNSKPFMMTSKWCWNPALRSWQCSSMMSRGRVLYGVCF